MTDARGASTDPGPLGRLLVTGGAHDLDAQAESDRRLAALFTGRPR